MGRPTKREEVRSALEEMGLSREIMARFDNPDAELPTDLDQPPETMEEWRQEWMKLLWQRRGEMKGIALVQGLKALAQLAVKEEDSKQDEETASLLDRIHALPPEHAAGLLRTRIGELELEMENHKHALREMEELSK